MPVRIQRKRTKGWKMPPNTVSVTRPGRYGNPYSTPKWARWLRTVRSQVDAYRTAIVQIMRGTTDLEQARLIDDFKRVPTRDDILRLRGKNLACFCALDQPCHADVLLELANA